MTYRSTAGRPASRFGGTWVLAMVFLGCASNAALALPPVATPLDRGSILTRAQFCQSKFSARVEQCPQIGALTNGYVPEGVSYTDPICVAAAQAKLENCLAKGEGGLVLEPN